MKRISLVIALVIFQQVVFAQSSTFYEQGLEKANEGKLEEAIALFSKAIDANPDDYYAWYNRGIAKSILERYQDALPDFEKTIQLLPNYKKGYLNRGIAKKNLKDYKGALIDYSRAIYLDSAYAEAYYDRAILYRLLDKKDSACSDFNQAFLYGMKEAEKSILICLDSTKAPIVLKKIAESDKYGFSSEQPVKVGNVKNQGVYLSLLRDPNGQPIKFERIGSCCFHKSPKGFNGYALLDKYKISYLDKEGMPRTAVVYLDFYEYEEPKILFGFKAME